MNLLHFYLYMFEPSHVIVIIFNSNHKISAPQSSTIKFFSTQGMAASHRCPTRPTAAFCIPPHFLQGWHPGQRDDVACHKCAPWSLVKITGKTLKLQSLEKKKVGYQIPGVFRIERKFLLKKSELCVFFSSQHKPHWFLNQMCFQPFLSTSTGCGFSLWKTSSNHIGSWNPRRLGVFFLKRDICKKPPAI